MNRLLSTDVLLALVEGDVVSSSGPALTGRNVLWSLSPAFDSYVRHRTRDGEVRLADGVEQVDEGDVTSYRFPVDEQGSDPQRLALAGSLEYRAHLGVLRVRLNGLALRADGDRVLVSAAHPLGVPGERVVLATAPAPGSASGALDVLRDGGVMLPVLTGEGSELFHGRYDPGTPLAPLVVARTAGHRG